MISLYDKICNEPLEMPNEPFVSDSLRHLITRLLDKDPESRISLVGTMRHPWITHNGAYPLETAQVCTHCAVLSSTLPKLLWHNLQSLSSTGRRIASLYIDLQIIATTTSG